MNELPKNSENRTLSIADFPEPLIHDQAVEYINKQFLHTDGMIYKIIGVDNRPPKKLVGVYLTLKMYGVSCIHVKVG